MVKVDTFDRISMIRSELSDHWYNTQAHFTSFFRLTSPVSKYLLHVPSDMDSAFDSNHH